MGRLLPGPQDSVAMESLSSRLLIDMGVVEPDFMSTIFSMYAEITPLMALLDMKNFKTQGLSMQQVDFTSESRYKVVGSNHVQYRIAHDDWRVERFRSNTSSLTYIDYENPTYTGLNKSTFYIYLDSNYIGGNEVILLADGKTQLYTVDKVGGKAVSGGVWEYRVQLDGANDAEYVASALLADGVEVQAVSTKYTQDWSTGGNEKYQFGGFGDAYLTLQRFKYSYSGTAAAMDKNKKVQGRWVHIAGSKQQPAFLTYAQELMMKSAAKSLEFQLLEGKGTVGFTDKKVKLHDGENQEILSGSGVLYSGDGPYEIPINSGWSPRFIQSLLSDIDTHVRPDENGAREMFAALHPTSYLSFQAAMLKMGATVDNNIEGTGDNKIINNTYKGFSLGGIKIYAVRSTALSRRPGLTLKDGTKSNEWDGLILPLGMTASGDRGIQLITLRPMKKGTVAGIDKGGNISNDIDGSTEHVLLQNGVISQIQPIKLYRPYANNLLTT